VSGPAPVGVADEPISTGQELGTRVDVVVAFTDLEGFTAFTATEGDEVAGHLLLDHHRAAEQITQRRGGRVVKRLGDGLLLMFSSAPAAVLSCLELRQTAPLRLRSGIHAGDVYLTADGDLIGHVVNLAAKVAASARPGELLVTDEVRERAAALSCLVFEVPTMRFIDDVVPSVPVSVTSRLDCEWIADHAANPQSAPDPKRPAQGDHR
jgi:class 3 adenylate cyclase